MGKNVLEDIGASLQKKEENLRDWLGAAPADPQPSELGPCCREDVEAHLAVLSDKVSAAATGDLGRCTVCQGTVDTRRLLADYTASVCLEHLSPEESQSLEQELELAQVVQQGLLPSEIPDVPGLEMAAYTRPAQIIGGDYFDFLIFDGGSPGLALGDVAGHGVSASLHMAGVQALTRALVPSHRNPAEAMAHIHRLFNHNTRYTTFVTLFLASYSPTSRQLVYCNAGHNPPFVVRGDGPGRDVAWLAPTGAAVGLVEEPGYRDQVLTLSPGDWLVLYTDGIVEAGNAQGEPFGAERLVRVVASHPQDPVQDVVWEMTRALDEFTVGRPLADDTTLIVGRVV
jgi:sigma-B regulation protein RsbU (phosphoserine phosphatase)